MRTSNRKSRGGGRPGGRRRGGGSPGGGRARRAPVEPLHPTDTPPQIESFREWSLQPGVLDAIEAMGIVKPTPIQALATQPVLDGRDVIAKAETGTGKTLAFGAPMMSRIDAERVSVLALVMCPTRELAEQVQKVLEQIGKPRGVGVALIVGGEPMEPQVKALQAGSQVVVGTPGRILDLYNQKFLSFPWTEFVVLDEADTMLEIGFIDDIKKILALTPDERQTLLFSATFPPDLLALAREHTRDPVEVATASGVSTVKTIDQVWMALDDEERALALTRLIEQSEDDDVFLVFCERRTAVDRLMRRLERLPYGIKALHGGYDQASRFRVMSAFRTGEVKALVATDVASRGLDVHQVTHVVNYAVPSDVTTYTHRIGRTGRAGREGKAISFVVPADRRRWTSILRDATWDIPEVDPPGPTRGRGRGGDRDRGRDRGRERERDDDRPRSRARDEGDERSERGRRPRRGERDGGREGERSSRHGSGRREREDDDRSPRGAARARARELDRDSGEGEPREDRPAREDQRRGADERPARRRGGRGREGGERPAARSEGRRDDRPRTGERRGRGGSREDRPERDDRSRAPQSRRERDDAPARAEDRPFGAGTEPERPATRRTPEPRTEEAKRDKPKREPRKKPEKPDTSGGGFGAGL